MSDAQRLLWIAPLTTLAFGLSSVQAAPPTSNQTQPRAGGAATYQKWCAPCHDPGIEHPGTHALMAKYGGQGNGVLKQWPNLDPALVKFTVRHGISIMPPFRKTEVTDQELEQLADWLAAQGKK